MAYALRRHQFDSDEEWQLYQQGKCTEIVTRPFRQWRYCEETIDPNSKFGWHCTEHDHEYRRLCSEH
jgi:hypothetical protein